MAVTNYLTNNGRLLLANLLVGQKLVYTKTVSSSAALNQPEIAEEILEPKQTVENVHAEQQRDSAVITSVFSCVDLEESYELKTIGLYAKLEGTDEDILYAVTVFSGSDIIEMVAKKRVEYKVSVYDSLANGTLSITVSDTASAPYEHVENSYRHNFIQTNNSSLEAIVDSGGFNNFYTGQEILFIPSVELMSNITVLNMGGRVFRLIINDLSGNPTAGTFSPHTSYVLTYRQGSFVYTDTSTFKVIDGVAHYWSNGWHTLEPAGKIIASCSPVIPNGALRCDGSLVSVELYPELYEVIGNTFGGDDTRFKLPSMTDSVIKGNSAQQPSGTMENVSLVIGEGFSLKTVCLYHYIYTGKSLL